MPTTECRQAASLTIEWYAAKLIELDLMKLFKIGSEWMPSRSERLSEWLVDLAGNEANRRLRWGEGELIEPSYPVLNYGDWPNQQVAEFLEGATVFLTFAYRAKLSEPLQDLACKLSRAATAIAASRLDPELS